MAAFNVLKFSQFTHLQGLAGDDLRAFFQPFADYLCARGLIFDSLSPDNEAACAQLSEILQSPDNNTPAELIESLYILTQLCQHVPESFYADAEELGMEVPQDQSAEQLAVRVWLRDDVRLRQRHAELVLTKARSFQYFSAAEDYETPFKYPSPSVIGQLELALDHWFQRKRRGTGCKVRMYPKGTEVWFLISHGDYFKRVGTWEEGKAGSIGFRPDRHDVVVYDQIMRELRIHAGTKELRENYRQQFGSYLFGRENHFPGTHKYSLEPLRKLGAKALHCEDVEGISWVKLSKLEMEVSEEHKHKRVECAEDVFAAMKIGCAEIPRKARLLSATFTVRFKDNPKPRSVTIKPSNVALYTRDDDSRTLDLWLVRRGFINQERVKSHEQLECVLEVS